VGVQLLIQACTLVSVNSLKSDLIPIAAKAFSPSANPNVKHTCVQMFMRVIQSNVPNKDKQEYLEMFFPKIIEQVTSPNDVPIDLLVECLAVLNKLTE
jgi:hypothetical protein